MENDSELQAQTLAGLPPSRLEVAGTSRKKARALLPSEAVRLSQRGIPSLLLSFDLNGALDTQGLSQWLADLDFDDDLADPEVMLHLYGRREGGHDLRIIVLSVGRRLLE
jgi:hypothetical protein